VPSPARVQHAKGGGRSRRTDTFVPSSEAGMELMIDGPRTRWPDEGDLFIV